MARRTPRGLALLAAFPALAACASRPPVSREPIARTTLAPIAGAKPPAAPVAQPVAAAPDEELAWDESVGWEHRVHFRPGEITRKRDPATYLTLKYAWLNDARTFKRILTAKVPVRDRSLIATPAEVCDPVFQTVVADVSPDRLFLRIEGGLTSKEAECLARLKAPLLYLAMCPYESTTYSPCDGDTELAALAGNANVAARVRGLAIAFSERESWAYLSKFPQLEYLAAHGAALKNADWQIVTGLCVLPGLVHLDVLDANFPGSSPFGDIEACAFRRRTFFGWTFPTGPSIGSPCALRRVMVGSLSQARRAELAAACPALKEIDVLFPR